MDNNQNQFIVVIILVALIISMMATQIAVMWQRQQQQAEEADDEPRARRFKLHERTNDLFATMWAAEDARFVEEYRMSKGTFMRLLGRIRHRLVRIDLVGDVVVPAKRLAICLARLTRGMYYRAIAELYGVGEATASSICNKVSEVIVAEMWDEYVLGLLPSTEVEMERLQATMTFPYAFGAVDGCHIQIQCPAGGAAAARAFHNYKGYYSVVLMALVDGRGRFLWTCCGQPGSTHDSTILQMTAMWHRFFGLSRLRVIDGIPAMILGDGAFPFRTFLMKRFNQARNDAQRKFDRAHSNARVIVENAFGMLKGRFRVLIKLCESAPDNVTTKTMACVILHNLLIAEGEIPQGGHPHDNVDIVPLLRHNAVVDNAAAARLRDRILPLLQ